MPLRIKCPTGHVMIVPDNRVGRELRCPRCDQAFIVPEVNKRQSLKTGQSPIAAAATSTSHSPAADSGAIVPATQPADDASRRLFAPPSPTNATVQPPKVREKIAPVADSPKKLPSKSKPPRKRTFPPRTGATESLPAAPPPTLTNPVANPVAPFPAAPTRQATAEPIAEPAAKLPNKPPVALPKAPIVASTMVASTIVVSPPAIRSPIEVEFVLPAEMPTVAIDHPAATSPAAASAVSLPMQPTALVPSLPVSPPASDAMPSDGVVQFAAEAIAASIAKLPAEPISLAPAKPPVIVRPAPAPPLPSVPPLRQAAAPQAAIAPQPQVPPPSRPNTTTAAAAPVSLSRTSSANRPAGVQWLAVAAMFAAIVSMIPAVADIIEFALAPHTAYVARWALVLLMLGVVQFAYGVYLLQLPDWSAVWVITLESLAMAAMYAMIVGLTLITAADGVVVSALQLHDQLAGGRATLWCLALCFLFLALAFLAGRTAVRWRKREQTLHGVGGLLPRI